MLIFSGGATSCSRRLTYKAATAAGTGRRRLGSPWPVSEWVWGDAEVQFLARTRVNRCRSMALISRMVGSGKAPTSSSAGRAQPWVGAHSERTFRLRVYRSPPPHRADLGRPGRCAGVGELGPSRPGRPWWRGPAARGRAQACLEPGRRAGMADIRVVSCEVSAPRQIPARRRDDRIGALRCERTQADVAIPGSRAEVGHKPPARPPLRLTSDWFAHCPISGGGALYGRPPA